jgi:NmrA-like family
MKGYERGDLTHSLVVDKSVETPSTSSSMSKLVTVFGATGLQGGSVIRAIQAHPKLSQEFKIRGATRNVDSPAAKELASSGVEMVNVNSHIYTHLHTSYERKIY